MNRKTAATVIITASLVVLMSGCAGVAAQGGQVHDDLSPAGNAAIMGLARGHVIVRDNLSPLANAAQQESIAQAAQSYAARAWSAEARREFHAQSKVQQQPTNAWSAEARREFHAQSSSSSVAQGFSPAAIREMKAGAPVQVKDDLSPLNSSKPTSTPQPDTVDDDLSPLRGSR